jgi:ribonucleoside-diphosphate reductase beta chain
MSIFEENESLKPYEYDYPQLMEFVKAMHGSFWQVEKFPFNRDIKDFKVKLTPEEQSALSRSMLAISVVENKVKSFWSDIYHRMPRTEIANVGYSFASNEVIHQLCYQKLLELLDLNEEFNAIFNVPAIQDRVKYLKKYLQGVNSRSNKEFTKSLILFTLLVENCSLFSQFFIVSAFYKYKDILKNFNDVVSASMLDENCHAEFGSELINIIARENPEWFDDDMEKKIRRNIVKAYEAEKGVIDWIFEHGELSFLSKAEVVEFLKSRFNDSLTKIGYSPEFELDETLLKKSDYIKLKMKTTSDIDFFNGMSVEYSKSKSFEEESLWD